MADNWRSKLITEGIARSPNRAMLRAVGFGHKDFTKPIVGVANGHSTMNPCNAGIQPLVDRAMAALESAGAKPQVFGTPTVTDGIGMGTEAMKYSLVSREVIADSIETVINGQGIMQSSVVREHASIPDDQNIMICIALGYPDESFIANSVKSVRACCRGLIMCVCSRRSCSMRVAVWARACRRCAGPTRWPSCMGWNGAGLCACCALGAALGPK